MADGRRTESRLLVITQQLIVRLEWNLRS